MGFPLKILIGSHLGSKGGGIPIQNELLLKSDLSKAVDLRFVETSWGNLNFVARGKWGIKNVFNALYNIWRFVCVFERFHPDVVDLGTTYGVSFLKHGAMALYAHYRKSKVILTFHCSIKRINLSSGRFNGRISAFILRRIDGVSAISKEWLILGDIIPTLKMRYIPNAIDSREYPAIVKPDHGGRVKILYLGHIGKAKGSFDLIEAIQLLAKQALPPYELLLVGDVLSGNEKEEVSFYIKHNSLSEKIKVLPAVYGSEKNALMQSCDVFVYPSHHEGMPLAVMEAMASGLPVVGTTVGGIPDLIVDGRTGFLIPPMNVVELAKSIRKLILDPVLRDQMGKSGAKKIKEELDISKKAARLAEFYEAVAEEIG